MKRHLLTTSLAAGLLLLGTLGCSKTEDAKSSSTGSYRLDGTLKNCNAVASFRSISTSCYTYDELAVSLTTTPQPASGAERLNVVFLKTTGLADTTYRCISMNFYTNGERVLPAAIFYSYPYTKSPLAPTGNNEFSGVFAGPAANSSTAYGAISQGVFTNVRF